MAHFRLTPQQVKDLSADEVEAMEFSIQMLERRQSETLQSLFGSLLGTSWNVDDLLPAPEKVARPSAQERWSLRQAPQRINVPLTLVVSQDSKKFNEWLKQSAKDMKAQLGTDNRIMNLPDADTLKGSVVVDMAEASRDDFLRMFGSYNGRF